MSAVSRYIGPGQDPRAQQRKRSTANSSFPGLRTSTRIYRRHLQIRATPSQEDITRYEQEVLRRREANYQANKGKRDREDLYTDNWDGSEWKGKKVNVLVVITAVSILAPLVGVVFAYFTYGNLWG